MRIIRFSVCFAFFLCVCVCVGFLLAHFLQPITVFCCLICVCALRYNFYWFTHTQRMLKLRYTSVSEHLAPNKQYFRWDGMVSSMSFFLQVNQSIPCMRLVHNKWKGKNRVRLIRQTHKSSYNVNICWQFSWNDLRWLQVMFSTQTRDVNETKPMLFGQFCIQIRMSAICFYKENIT